ncbi:MAG: DUF1566 domain-containing protein [bacterium]
MKKVNPKKSKRNSGRNARKRCEREGNRNDAFAPPSLRYGVATAIAVVIISVLTIFTIVQAGNITPPSGAPSAKFYTLSEIYNFITSNTTAAEGGHSFAFSDALSSTHHTLSEIYNALAGLISADKVKLGTTYLNVAGALTPDGGTAAAGDLFSGKTANLTSDWNLDAGTLNLACNTATFDGAGNLVADGYDGAGIGNNRWCITESGDVLASEMKTGKIGWVDGIAITGTGTQILSADNQTVTAGYYEATTLSTVDSDLAVGNIRSGVNIFGFAGNSNVVNTSTGDATASEILSGYKAWVDGAEITGSASSGYSDWSTQKNVRWDDWRYGAGTTGSPFDEYTGEESTWTQTDAGGDAAKSVTDNAVTVSLSSNEVWQDTRTGLYWSNRTASQIDNEFRYDATGQCNFTDTGTANTYCDNQDPTSAYTEDNDVSANDFCLNLQLDADNDSVLETDWRLPSQKELMQAYIDGSANHLPNPDSYFWSATEYNGNAANAWYVTLNDGYTYSSTKSNNYYARCVRP